MCLWNLLQDVGIPFSNCFNISPFKADFTGRKVVESFLNHIVKLHGFSSSLVSDRDNVFTSAFWKQIFKLSGTSLAMSFANHPLPDCQTEATNKCLEMYLRCFVGQVPYKWSQLLPWSEFWNNSSYQYSI